MNDKIKKEVLLSAVSEILSKRDKAKAEIEIILENGRDVNKIAKLFKKIFVYNMTIQDIQIYYAENFKTTNDIKKGEENDNNS